jgi:hypothetical protein
MRETRNFQGLKPDWGGSCGTAEDMSPPKRLMDYF